MLQRSSSMFSYVDETGQEVYVLSSDDEEPTPKPQRRTATTQPLAAPVFTSLDDYQQEDTDNEDLPDIYQYSQSMTMSSQATSSTASASRLSALYSSPDATAKTAKKRKSSQGDAFDDDEVQLEPKRARKSTEATRAEKAQKAIQRKADAEAKKLNKEQEKLNKIAEKQAKKQVDAAAKEAQKHHKRLNKLVADKKQTLKDMTVEISNYLYTSPTFSHMIRPLDTLIREKAALAAEDDEDNEPVGQWPIVKFTPEGRFSTIPNIIRWSRQIYANYNQAERQWVAVPQPYRRDEGLYVIYYTLAQLREIIEKNENNTLGNALQKLRKELGEKHQLFLMIDGFHAANSRLNSPQKVMIERVLAEWQVLYKCFIVHVEGVEDTVTWLYDITADLGIKPHKLIDRTHLSICADPKHLGAATSPEDIYVRMLQQIYRVNEPMSLQIVKSGFPTLRTLFEVYRDPQQSQRQKDALLVGIPAKRGGRTTIGITVSSRVHSVFGGTDPLSMIGCQGNETED